MAFSMIKIKSGWIPACAGMTIVNSVMTAVDLACFLAMKMAGQHPELLYGVEVVTEIKRQGNVTVSRHFCAD